MHNLTGKPGFCAEISGKMEIQNEPNNIPLLALMCIIILNKGILSCFQHLLDKEAGYLLKDFEQKELFKT